MATAVFYASSTGNTKEAAKKIAKELGDIKTFDISFSGMDKISEFEKVIIGCSTWGEGELQDDFEEAWDEFCSLDFSGKTVALFGLGDQDGYADEYVDAMGIIYEQIVSKGANVIGSWSVDGYEHDNSKAQVDDSFVGLALDEDNQSELSDERIQTWCETIKGDIL